MKSLMLLECYILPTSNVITGSERLRDIAVSAGPPLTLYVGATCRSHAIQKRPGHASLIPNYATLPGRISQPFGCEKRIVISFRLKEWG